MVLQIEAKHEILHWPIFRAKSIEKHPGLENFFELTTPTEQGSDYACVV